MKIDSLPLAGPTGQPSAPSPEGGEVGFLSAWFASSPEMLEAETPTDSVLETFDAPDGPETNVEPPLEADIIAEDIVAETNDAPLVAPRQIERVVAPPMPVSLNPTLPAQDTAEIEQKTVSSAAELAPGHTPAPENIAAPNSAPQRDAGAPTVFAMPVRMKNTSDRLVSQDAKMRPEKAPTVTVAPTTQKSGSPDKIFDTLATPMKNTLEKDPSQEVPRTAPSIERETPVSPLLDRANGPKVPADLVALSPFQGEQSQRSVSEPQPLDHDSPLPIRDRQISSASHVGLTTLRETSQTPAIANQLTAQLTPLRSGVTEIRLSPEELGRVTVAVTTHEQGVSLAISADRPETIDLMRRNAESIQNEFRRAGVDQLDLNFRESSSQSSGKNAQQETETASTPAPTSITVTSVTEHYRQSAHSDHLDLRV